MDEGKKKKKKLFKNNNESSIAKKKDTEVPLMPIASNELPIIPKFIHVQNSYSVSEDNYNELIELIRSKKSRNVAIFQKRNADEKDNEPTEESKSSQDKEDFDKNNLDPEKKKRQNFSFLNIDHMTSEELSNYKFDEDKIKDVTEYFLEQFLPVGTYGVLSALQNVEKSEGLISVNFYGLNRCQIKKVLEVNKKFHLVEISHVEENDVLDDAYQASSKHLMSLIQNIYQNADQPTRYAIDLLKSN